jgi:hypothetical protein
MKFTSPVPCIRTWAIQALLSPFFETWQSVQVRVSRVRTVCGTYVENDVPAKPPEDVVCCCE